MYNTVYGLWIGRSSLCRGISGSREEEKRGGDIWEEDDEFCWLLLLFAEEAE